MTEFILAGPELECAAAAAALKVLKPEKLLCLPKSQALRAAGLRVSDEELERLSERFRAEKLDAFKLPHCFSIDDYRLLALDMDSTLIVNECIDEMADAAGCGKLMETLTLEAMEGKWDFSESLTRRVKLLAGQPQSVIDAALGNIRLTAGAQSLIDFMKQAGVQCWILSGGFNCVTSQVARRLGMNGSVSNELVVKDGKLTGEVTGPAGGSILDATGKKRALEVFLQAAGAELSQAVTAGDGANDIPMIEAAGLGFAFHAKSKTANAARRRIDFAGLDGIALHFEEFWRAAEVL